MNFDDVVRAWLVKRIQEDYPLREILEITSFAFDNGDGEIQIGDYTWDFDPPSIGAQYRYRAPRRDPRDGSLPVTTGSFYQSFEDFGAAVRTLVEQSLVL